MSVIRKRGEFQYQAIVRQRGYPQLSKTFVSRREAITWATSVENDQNRGIFMSRAKAEQTTLGALLKKYSEEVAGGHKGADSEKLRLAMLARLPLADRYVSTLAPSDFAEYRNKRLKTRKPATVIRELSLFSAVLATAIREWGINITNPVVGVARPTARNERKRGLSADEESRLFAELEPRTRDDHGRLEPGGTRCDFAAAIVRVAIETAMRRSEILGLTWDRVHLEERFVELHDTKNGHSREVPLSSPAVVALKSLGKPDQASKEKVFPVTPAAFKKIYERAVARAKIENLTFHDLRRVATARLAKKLSVLDLASTTGHRQLNVLFTRYYSISGTELAAKLA